MKSQINKLSETDYRELYINIDSGNLVEWHRKHHAVCVGIKHDGNHIVGIEMKHEHKKEWEPWLEGKVYNMNSYFKVTTDIIDHGKYCGDIEE